MLIKDYDADNDRNDFTQAATLGTLTSTTHITSGWQSTSSSRCQHQQHVNTLDHSVYISQALLFYIPRCIWLSLEGGLMKFLVMGHQGWNYLKITLVYKNIFLLEIFFLAVIAIIFCCQSAWWMTTRRS